MNQTGYKVTHVSLIDLSDYARPVAVWIARKIKDTRIHVYSITIFHSLLMFLAAFLITKSGLHYKLLASVLILVKNILDGVDGSLARIRNSPSRVGRFLDSNLDFVGNLFLFLALIDIPVWMRLVSFFSCIIQGSFFNYYYILFRNIHGEDSTSRIKEDETSPYPYDNPVALRILYFFYTVFYQWQDKLVSYIDQFIKGEKRNISSFFVSCLSVNGLGFQHLIIILLISQQPLIVWWFAVVMNIYLFILLMSLHRT